MTTQQQLAKCWLRDVIKCNYNNNYIVTRGLWKLPIQTDRWRLRWTAIDDCWELVWSTTDHPVSHGSDGKGATVAVNSEKTKTTVFRSHYQGTDILKGEEIRRTSSVVA